MNFPKSHRWQWQDWGLYGTLATFSNVGALWYCLESREGCLLPLYPHSQSPQSWIRTIGVHFAWSAWQTQLQAALPFWLAPPVPDRVLQAVFHMHRHTHTCVHTPCHNLICTPGRSGVQVTCTLWLHPSITCRRGTHERPSNYLQLLTVVLNPDGMWL